MEKELTEEIRQFILTVLESVKSQLDQESITAVIHYVNHDEYEMAFEGLYIEIFKIKDNSMIDFEKSKNIAELLKLNKESVFDFNFWNHFTEFIGNG